MEGTPQFRRDLVDYGSYITLGRKTMSFTSVMDLEKEVNPNLYSDGPRWSRFSQQLLAPNHILGQAHSSK